MKHDSRRSPRQTPRFWSPSARSTTRVVAGTHRRTLVSGGLAAALALLSAGCQHRLKDPAAPDTSPVEERYDDPRGLLEAPNLEEVTTVFEERIAVAQATGNLGELGALINQISGNEDIVNSTGGQSSTGGRLLAVINATRVCRGPEGDDVLDAKRFGTITMTAKGGLRGLFPVVWGRFNDCVDHRDQPYTIDGEYSVTVREGAEGDALLVIFDGTIETEAGIFDGSLDLRLLSNGTVEVRVNSATGDVILALNKEGQVLARDRTGQWTCDPEKLTCSNSTTGRVISP